MAEFILTDKEKEDASYLDCGDEALGKLVKMMSVFMHNEYGKDSK